MNPRSLRLVFLIVVALSVGCTKESIVEVPGGHVGLVCSNDDRPEKCGLWLHDPGKLVLREDEKLRLADCEPFVRNYVTKEMRTRDSVEVEVRADVSYEVNCIGDVRRAFRVVRGDVDSGTLFIAYGLPGLNKSLQLASTTLLSHEIAKDPERFMDLATALAKRPDSVSSPLTVKRFIVTSINLQEGNGDWKNIYSLTSP